MKEMNRMNQSEYAKCKAAAELYMRQQKRIITLENRIAVLEERMNRIDQEDREVFLLVRMNRERCGA